MRTTTEAGWLNRLKETGLEHKYNAQLDDLAQSYPKKITQITELIINGEVPQKDQERLLAKTKRLKHKLATVLKEKELRAEGKVKRTPVGTIYHIDYVYGSDANDGLSTGNAWKTIHKYTTLTSRSPGDIGKLRANTTWDYGAGGEATDINFDEDGTANSLITLKGCDSIDDPWGDGSDVRATIDFNNAAYNLHLQADDYWHFENLDIKKSADTTYEMFYVAYTKYVEFDDCIFHNTAGATTNGLKLAAYTTVKLANCQFYDNNDRSLYVDAKAVTILDNCTFDSGSINGTNYGIECNGNIYIVDTTFGSTTAHNTADLYLYSGNIHARNTVFDSTEFTRYTYGDSARLHSEDHDQVKGAQKAEYYAGIVTRDTGVTRGGGASSSAKMMPASPCGIYYPLPLADDYLAGDFKIWVPASATTITIYVRSEGAWGTYPTAAQLYIQASYLNHAANATRSNSTASTQVLSDATTWVALTTTFTPAQAGWAYVHLNLGKYEASKGVYIDIKPIIS